MNFHRLFGQISILVVCALAACSGTSQLNVFTLSDGNRLFFVRPVEFKTSGLKAKLDITYNTTPNKDATVNVSFFGSNVPIERLRRLSFILPESSDTLECVKVNKMFCEEDECRYTSQLTAAQVQLLSVKSSASESKTLLSASFDENAIKCTASSDFKDAMIALRKNLP